MSTVDAAFTKAVATIKQLTSGPNALKTPPPERRHLLYGLFKQSMEGNVDGMMPRPPNGGDNASKTAQSKWDAWKSQEGLTKQQAKLEYVRCLLDTMHALRPKEMKETPPAWVELEKVYEEASLSASANASVNASTNATANTSNHSFGGANSHGGNSYVSYGGGPNRGNYRGHSRRMSTASSASTYSHFLRAKPQSTYSEFGLSEKDRNEIEADQLVDQLQNAYPPILPGAVVPPNVSSRGLSSPGVRSPSVGSPAVPGGVAPGGVVPGGVDPSSLSSNNRLGKSHNRIQQRLPLSVSNAATAATSVNSSHLNTPVPPTPDSFGSPSDGPHKFRPLEMASALINYVRQHIASGFNQLLYSITLDVVKLLSVLSIIRLIASRPEWLSRLPISKRILSTLGKLIEVLLDEIGVEIKIKPPRNVRRP